MQVVRKIIQKHNLSWLGIKRFSGYVSKYLKLHCSETVLPDILEMMSFAFRIVTAWKQSSLL